MWDAARRYLPIGVGVLGFLGAAIGLQQHPTVPSLTPILAIWSTLPALVGWFLTLPLRGGPASNHCKALLAATYAPTAIGVAGLSFAILRGPPPAEGAAHMAPFLWPVLLCLLGIAVYSSTRVLLLLANRLHAA